MIIPTPNCLYCGYLSSDFDDDPNDHDGNIDCDRCGRNAIQSVKCSISIGRKIRLCDRVAAFKKNSQERQEKQKTVCIPRRDGPLLSSVADMDYQSALDRIKH
jgi:hypothetical protein